MSDAGFLAAARQEFGRYKRLGEGAFDQLKPSDYFDRPDDESNSIRVMIRHLTGNMRSRWTNVFEEDGEKPDRHRDTEFEEDLRDDPESIRREWEAGWALVFGFLDGITEADLDRTIHIRGEPQSVTQAVARQIGHYAYHVGQIVYLARMAVGEDWKSLSIPRGQSEEFNRRHSSKRG